jgi:hypothetical protein
MSIETATLILRRKPQDAMQRRACDAALETIARSMIPLGEVEVDIMRPFTLAELVVIASLRRSD